MSGQDVELSRKAAGQRLFRGATVNQTAVPSGFKAHAAGGLPRDTEFCAQVKPWAVDEHRIVRDERQVPSKGRRCDPQISGVLFLMQWVPEAAAFRP